MKNKQQANSIVHIIHGTPASSNQISVFDSQDGKLVTGTIIEKVGNSFSLQCTDRQIRKFDISLLPKPVHTGKAIPGRIGKYGIAKRA